MNEEQKALAMECVREYVWSGFYDPDEIVEMIDEAAFRPGEIVHDWLRSQIERAFREKQAEEASWPAESDCDRLDRVFASLGGDGILSLQNAGYTQSDGLDDVAQFYQEAGGEQSGIVGYCFYHGQDLERVMKRGDLYLAFGDVGRDDEKGAEIGRRIMRAFEAAGFAVEWDGTVKTRLLVKGIQWQRCRRSA